VSYELRIKPSAVRELMALQDDVRSKVVARIQALAEDPRPRGCEKLTGGPRYRVRQGSYRVLYEVDDEAREVTVVRIGHRRDVYR
jgi:mRNA interferase RelE/StbE